MPRTLHVDAPSPHVDWDDAGLRLATVPVHWPDTGAPRRAAISSFGISGTNAHAIVEQAPPDEPAGLASPGPAASRTTSAEPNPVVPCVLSGHDGAALRGQAARLLAHTGVDSACEPVEREPNPVDVGLVDLGWSLATTRARLEHRAVVIARNRRDLVNGLVALAGGGPPPPNVVTGVAEAGCRTALLFPCDAGAWSGMGRRLRQAYPAFADALHEVCSQLEGPLGWPVGTLLSGEADPADARLPARNAVVLFAVEVALLRLVLSLGVSQDAVLGHGIGEVAATHAAGALALADAAALVAARAAAAPPGSAGPSGSPDCGCAELADGLRALLADGVRGFLVVGPDGGLTALVRRLADEAGRDGSIVAAPMLLPGHDERFTALRALGLLHVAGAQVDWGRVFDGVPAKRVPLPAYAFQRRRFWLAPRSDPAGHEVLLNSPDPAGLTPPAVRDGGRQPTTGPGPNLTEIVVDCVAEALRTDRGSVPLTRPLPSAGMDSLTAMDVTSRLLTLLHVNVPVSSVLLAKALPELVGEIELLLATAGARDAAAVVDAMDAGEV